MTTPIQKLLGAGIPVEAAKLLGFTAMIGQTAIGNVQSNSLPVTANMVQIISAAVSTGVTLPPASRTDIDFVLVRNDGANTISIWPAVGEKITNSLNAAITTAAGAGTFLVRVSPTQWLAA